MEIPPSSSFAQSTALFSGLSKDEVTNSINSIGPTPERNSLLYSNNVVQAASMSGATQDFKYEDFKEAYRIMNGPAKYPFQNIVQISNYKFDPYYFDGSENTSNFNVNENLIGTPLGTSVLEDPRLNYVKNIMLLKEYEGAADQLNDSYIKELYMVNSEKGSNYYINMLERQQESLDYWSREGRARKNKSIPGIAFTYNLPAGETQRTKKKLKLNQTIYSETPSVQRNFRRDVFNRLPVDPNDTVNDIRDPDGIIHIGSSITPLPRTPITQTPSTPSRSSVQLPSNLRTPTLEYNQGTSPFQNKIYNPALSTSKREAFTKGLGQSPSTTLSDDQLKSLRAYKAKDAWTLKYLELESNYSNDPEALEALRKTQELAKSQFLSGQSISEPSTRGKKIYFPELIGTANATLRFAKDMGLNSRKTRSTFLSDKPHSQRTNP